MFFLAAMMFAAFTTASAQEQEPEVIAEFQPHWFLQLQGGAAHTLGEAKFMDLISPTAQLAVGYQFNPVLGLRLQGSGWESKGGWVNYDNYKWNYVSAGLDLKINLINLFGGWKPKRVFGMNLIVGGAANIGWNNGEANAINADILKNHPNGDFKMEYLWDGTKVRPVGRFGLDFDFRCSDRVSINLEGNANILTDKYNSKKAENPDWYFNALLGVKIALGPTVKYTVIEPDPVIIEPAPKPEPKPQPKPEPKPIVKKPEMKTEIFYPIREVVATGSEAAKLQNLISFLKENPDTKVDVKSYADAGTGNPKINQMYAQKRADNVKKALIEAGIAESRITAQSFGDTVQPYSENDKNRVSIAIAK